MKILVQPGGPDRRVPWPPLTRPPRYFPQGTPTAVELTPYIQKRLDDGDLVKVEAAAATPAPAAPAPAGEDAAAKLRATIDTSAARSAADKKGD
jgi:hypothetical protein